MNILKKVLSVLKLRRDMGMTREEVVKSVINSVEGKMESNNLLRQDKKLKEKDVYQWMERKYRASIVTLLEHLNMKGDVAKAGNLYKITDLGTARLSNL